MTKLPSTARAIALRRMHPDDLPAVLAVEAAAYATPWSDGIFRDCLRAGYYCLVAQDERCDDAHPLIGHAVMLVAAGECHVLNLCIHPARQRRGLGRRMLRRLLALARRQEADTAFLECRASNRGAIGLYESEGFNEIGRRRGYYPDADGDGREDAVVMARAL